MGSGIIGGGRSSARETASRVAAGAVAHRILSSICPDLVIRGAVVQIGDHAVNRDNWNWDTTQNNPFFCPDADIVPVWESFQMKRENRLFGRCDY